MMRLNGIRPIALSYTIEKVMLRRFGALFGLRSVRKVHEAKHR